MKKFVFITLLIALAAMLSANTVSINEAIQVAKLKLQIEGQNNHSIDSSEVVKNDAGLEIAYLFNLKPEGFVLVSTDSDINPIIGYSFENQFITEKSYRNAALDMITHDQTNRHEVLDQMPNEMRNNNNDLWNAYLRNDLDKLMTRDGVWPPENYQSPNDGWMHTEWDQSYPYFNFCPLDNAGNGRSVVGCVATAATQVIYYHKNFEQPNFTDADDYWSGYDTYVRIDDHAEDNDFPAFPELNSYLQTAEEHLENNTAYTNDDYAALCFAFGITVDMNYGSSASGGSGAYTGDVDDAFVQRWGYESATHYQGFSTGIKNIMIGNMQNGLPGILGIIQSGAPYGHAIVFDGYNENDDTFHLNYGWSGNSNGWYNIPSGMPQFDTITSVIANIDDGYDTFDLTGNINAEGNDLTGLDFIIRQNDYVINVETEDNGDFEVPYLLPGEYLVEATLPLADGGYYYYSQVMNLTAANGYISISMLPFTEFTGTVSADVAINNATVAIYKDGVIIRSTQTDADGSFTLPGILPGNYVVTASMQDNYFGAADIEVTFNNQEVDIAMQNYPYDCTINFAGPATDVHTFPIPFTLSMGIQIAGETLANYSDDVFTGVRFKSPADPENAEIFAQIWEDNTLLCETEVTDFSYGEWVTAIFDNFIKIDTDKIYYAGYKIISGDGVMAWHDNGPRVEGGAFTSNTGWIVLPASNDYNFNIQALTVSETLIGEDNEMLPLTKLNNNYPNPFNPTTTISFSIAKSGNVNLDIYNVKGQKVKTLLNSVQTAGDHSAVWNGKDDNNNNLSSGVYFYKLQTEGYTSTKKMLLLK